MKSIFTKLSTLLLCGVVAMVGCTDFSEDIQAVDKKVDDLTASTQTELASLKSAITDLEAKLAAQYATKDEVAALKTALENSIASEVDALSKDIADVNAALKAAEDKINGAIADLDDKKADKTAVDAAIKTATEAIAALQSQLEAAKGELEAEIDEVKAEIAATEEELAAQIGAVDAKANELHNTLLALSDYLANLEAKVNELKGTLDALSEYLPKMKAELEEKINAVDAKAIENFNTLLALSDHLAEYEATTDFKLVELQGSLAALSVYLEEYEASVDAKFKEILNTFDSLDGFLDEKFATLDATDTDLYNEINGIREAFTTLNNLLEDEVKARQEADEALYTKISEEVALQIEAMQEYYTQLYNRVVDLEAADDAIYVEMENIRTYVAQAYNSLSYEIKAVDAALKAHIAAFEAFKAAYEEKVAELEATDTDLYGEINGLREVITTINNHIDDLRAEDEAIYLEINGLRENLTQLQNAINNRIDEEVKDLKADILDKFNILNTVILETEKRVNDKFMHTLELISDLDERIVANAAAIAELEAAIKALNEWVEAHGENYNELVQLITDQFTAINKDLEDLQAEDVAIYDYIKKTATELNNLIAKASQTIQGLKDLCSDQQNQIGANKDAIYALQSLLAKLEADLDARLDALENRVDNIEIDIEALEKALADLETALENGLAETLYLAFKNDEGVMGNVKAFEDKVSALVEELRNADGKIREDFAAELADILVRLASIDTELAEIAEWQTSVNTTLGQLSSQIYEAIGLAETQLKKDIEEAVALLKAEDAKIREEIEAGLAETLYLAIKNDEGVMDNVRAFEEKMDNIVKALQSQINDLLARVQSIVLVPEYNDGKATIHFASLDGYPIIGPSVLKYRVQAVKGEDAASISEALVKAWKNNPDALQYHVVPVKERTRNAQPEATLNIENVTAEKDFIYVTVRPADFDGAFYTSVMDQKSNVEALVDGLFSRTTSYSAAIIFTDGVNNVTSEYYNLYPEATEVTMKIVIPDEEGSVKDITNVFPGEERQKLAYTDVETSKAILAGHDLLFTVNGEDYTKDALVKEFGYDINIIHTTVADYNGEGFDPQTIVLPYGVRGETFPYAVTNGKDARLTIYPGMDCTVKLPEPLSKEHVGNVMTVTYTYTVNEEVSVQTSSEVEITHEIVNVTFEEVTIPWSLKLANELRGGEDKDFAPYYKSYTTDAIKHDCPYDLGTMLTSMSKAGELEKVIKVNGKKVGEYVTIPRTDYDDANRTARIKFQSGSPKFSAEGPTKYEIVYHGIYNNQYDVTATAIVVFEQIPSFEITSDVTLASQKGWFVGDDALVKDGILDKNLAADLGYETAADALNQLYAAYTDAASTKATEITFGGKTIKGSRGNGNVQLNVTENHDLTKVYLYNGDVEELLGKAQLEDDSVFAIKHTITTWTGAKVVYTINAKTDLPDYVLSTDPVRVKNDIVEVKGEIVNEEYTVDVADLAKYYYIFNEGLETLEAPKTNVPELEVEFTLAGQNKAEGFYIKDDIYNFPVKFENKGLLDMNTAVVNWGTYPYTEIVVNATLKANGYPIDSKPITLVTKDPLHILFEDVDVTVDHKAGTNDEPVVAKVYHNFNITSDVEPEAGNLCNIDAKTIAGLFWYSHADKTYGIEVETEVLQVYYEENGVRKNWDREKYTIGYRVDDNGEYILNEDGEKIFDGNIYINADDAGILVPIKAEVGVRVSHRIHAASPVCVNEGTITVTFNPAE